MRRVLQVLMVAMLAILLVTACAPVAQPALVQPAAGQVTEVAPVAAATEPAPASQPSSSCGRPVKVIMMTGQDQEGWQELADQYKQETGKEVVVEGQGRGEYHAALPTQLLGGATSFDIAHVIDTWIPEFAESGVLEPLDKWVDATPGYDTEDLLPVGVYSGKRYAIPVDYSHFYLYYRSDLIDNPPQTWDEVYEVARQFSQSTNPSSPTKYGITGDYITGEVLPQTWLNLLWPMDGDIVDASGNVTVDSDQAVQAASVLYQWAKEGLVPPNLAQIGWNDQIDQFVNGQAAMILPGWNAAYIFLPDAKGPYSDKWEATLVPGVKQADGSVKRVIYVQSWSFAMNAASPCKEEAAQFLMWGTSSEGLKAFGATGKGMPSRRSALSDPELQKQRPDFALAVETFPYVRYAPQITYWSKVFQALDVALADILNLRAEPKVALDEAAVRIRQAVGSQ